MYQLRNINGKRYFCKSYSEQNFLYIKNEYERVKFLSKIVNVPNSILREEEGCLCYEYITNSKNLEDIFAKQKVKDLEIDANNLNKIFSKLGKDLSKIHKHSHIYADFGLCNIIVNKEMILYYIDPSFTPLNQFKMEFTKEDDRYLDISVLCVSLFIHSNNIKIFDRANNYARLDLFNHFLGSYIAESAINLSKIKILYFSFKAIINDILFNLSNKNGIIEKALFIIFRIFSVIILISFSPLFSVGKNNKKDLVA
jgi:tRNA A-37 threonylcarbamoyl transferase component Bud32